MAFLPIGLDLHPPTCLFVQELRLARLCSPEQTKAASEQHMFLPCFPQ